MKFFSASKAAAIAINAFPLIASAFPVPSAVNWLAGRNLEEPPAVAAEVDQFPKFVPRSHEVPGNHTNGTYGDAPEHGYDHKYHKRHHGLTPLPRNIEVPGSKLGHKVQDVHPPKVDFKPATGVTKKRDHTQSYCPDCNRL
ncbi:hypothetical protein L211DRAFT_893386 [Terfezia boudieri ATCC MYA-4762]|uniref:Uncharacterized protein n=1 Tax=Terfezia boudieri ATCC MYA-4762 TaxID=1051890 RepID=A0A3N4LC34_9PEZI|nr:hypothetical protein L211DRAFT_893386 [Terfezia boudieri ATCC MYA-4762]